MINGKLFAKFQFQSTPPVKAATRLQVPESAEQVFQSTPPVKAATCAETSQLCTAGFQSTPPVKAATSIKQQAPPVRVISIHAAREGGDCKRLRV